MMPLPHITALSLFVRDCATDGSTLLCKLGSVLRGLEMFAMVLGLVFLLVVSAAMLVYRRKKCDRSSIL